jgi:hypothetical protein
VCLVACGPVKGTVPDAATPDGPDEPDRELVVESRATPIRNVDVLFVIDDSSTMANKQMTLANNIGKFITALETIPGGLPDLHLGVITTDMGTKGSGSQTAVSQSDQPQTPQAYAAELFDRACQLEVGGDAMGAMKLFAAAVRVDAQLRYLRRAASCACVRLPWNPKPRPLSFMLSRQAQSSN